MTWDELRFTVQTLFLGFDADARGMLMARTMKAIKSENFGGPKAKHLEHVMNALCFSDIDGVVVMPLDVVTCLESINWRKESVRAIRILGFLLIMFKHGSQLDFNGECREGTLRLLSEMENFWCQPESRPCGGYSHWDSPVVKQKFANLVAYVRSKVPLLARYSEQLPMFNMNLQMSSWSPDGIPTEMKIEILSLTLPALSQLSNSVSSIEITATLTTAESAAFKASIPQLMLDMQQLLVVNTRLILAIARDDSVSPSVCDSLLAEYADLREKLLTLRVASRGSLELVFRPKDLPVISKIPMSAGNNF